MNSFLASKRNTYHNQGISPINLSDFSAGELSGVDGGPPILTGPQLEKLLLLI